MNALDDVPELSGQDQAGEDGTVVREVDQV